MATTLRRVLSSEMEASYVPATCDGSGVIPLYDLNWAPEVQMHEPRPLRPWYGGYQAVAGKRHVAFSFSCDLRGNGTAGVPPEVRNYLRISGLTETFGASSVDYYLNPSGAQTASVKMYDGTDGYPASGVVGNSTFTLEDGLPVKMDFEGTGLYGEPAADATMQWQDGLTTVSPACLNMSLTIDSTTFQISNLNFTLGNVGSLLSDGNADTGYFRVEQTDQVITGSYTVRLVGTATYNHWNKVTTNDQGDISATIGSTAGNKLVLSLPNAQTIGFPSQEDVDGEVYVTCNFVCEPDGYDKIWSFQ